MPSKKDLQQAQELTKDAIKNVKKARKKLHSAKRWGWTDMAVGKGGISFIKHYKIRKVKKTVRQADKSLKRLDKTLKGLDIDPISLKRTGSIKSFLDIFQDHLIFDFLVQRDIRKNIHSLDDLLSRLEKLEKDLQDMVASY